MFFGAGGGRWSTITQNRATGGFRIHTEKTNLHTDPGPGTLVRLAQYKISPNNTNAIFISHCHPDHYTDGEVMIEAMTKGMTKKTGIIIGSISVLDGTDKYENAISKYHQSMSKVIKLIPYKKVILEDITLTATPTKHGDKTGIGFVAKTEQGIIGYTSDTDLLDDFKNCFNNLTVFIANVMRPKNEIIEGHLCSNKLIDLVNSFEYKPKLIVLNHMGLKMKNPEKECEYIENITGVKTIPAKLGLSIGIYDKEKINISYLVEHK